jgi:hypothetical protein
MISNARSRWPEDSNIGRIRAIVDAARAGLVEHHVNTSCTEGDEEEGSRLNEEGGYG